MTKRAKVYYDDMLAGTLEETAMGEYCFQYDSAYLEQTETMPISLTLPKQVEPYIAQHLFPFFDGLIPEGWLLDIAAENWKLNPRDRMNLLLHFCQDCIGNVSVVAAHD